MRLSYEIRHSHEMPLPCISMFPALNMAEFDKKKKKKDTVVVIALYERYGGESRRFTFKRIPLRFALLPMELF